MLYLKESAGWSINEQAPSINYSQVMQLLSLLSQDPRFESMFVSNPQKPIDEPREQKSNVVSVVDTQKSSSTSLVEDICRDKLEELKRLLSDARRTVSGDQRENDAFSTSSVSRSNSESDCRAGKYHKKPAPRVPELTKSAENLDDSAKPVKATLVIKTGSIKGKNFRDKKSGEREIRISKSHEGLAKLLKFPKTIFQGFHKENNNKEVNTNTEDNIEGLLLRAAQTENLLDDTYVSLRSDGVDDYDDASSTSSEDTEIFVDTQSGNEKEQATDSKKKLIIRQMSRSPTRGGNVSIRDMD